MKITEKRITVADLTKGYVDKNDDGVFAYDGHLTVRPAYQREFVYSDKDRNAVIDSILKSRPLNVMHWAKLSETDWEVLDGQQRTISICQYVNGDFAINYQYFFNLTQDEKNRILNYELFIYECEGTDKEKLEWFQIINRLGVTLTDQELLNATYTGAWLADAKTYFSKRNCVAEKLGKGYVKGNPIRQELLEKVLEWIAARDGYKCGAEYMAKHQTDTDASDLWQYYQSVMAWAKMLFPTAVNGITDVQNWGELYNKYSANAYNFKALKAELDALVLDDDVTRNAGVIPYILSAKTPADERSLSIRAFTPAMKLAAFNAQKGVCPLCSNVFTIDQMEGDHIVPWSRGGKTTASNLQMLCKDCNSKKGGK